MLEFDTKSYDFKLPQERIAQIPANPRDSSRLMVLDRKKGTWEHHVFRELPDLLQSQDVLVANNSKVMRARLIGNRRGPGYALAGKVEFLLLKEKGPELWEGAFHASGRARIGFEFYVQTLDSKGLIGKIVSPSAASPFGTVWVQFNRDPLKCGAGRVPLPPYIRSQDGEEEFYQTIYAKKEGSAAAPTAGFHFTSFLTEKLKTQNIGWEEITLHVGLGTFRPVKTHDIREHQMHEEVFEISENTARNLDHFKRQGRRIIAVGTTSARTLESAWDGRILSGVRNTRLFLYPGGDQGFHFVDAMITNFHLPRSTLLMLVCAFAGKDFVLSAYQEAIGLGYRFYSFGDAMLIL